MSVMLDNTVRSPDLPSLYTPVSVEGKCSNNHSNSDSAHPSSDDSHIYEDIDVQAPPKLAPVSGVLGSKCKAVIRPIAFKPVTTTTTTRRSTATPSSLPRHASPYSESEVKSLSRYNVLQGWLDDDGRSLTYSVDSCIKLSDTPASYLSSRPGGSCSALRQQTPSPSDSGVAELEAMLREKDSEINYLRETLEQNEHVIFKVYEEKEQSWQRETKRLRAMYETKLRLWEQRLAKAEHVWSLQNYQIQQEKRKLTAGLEECRREKESLENRVEQFRREVETLRSRLEEAEWGVCQKSGEISLLKCQLKDSQDDRINELLALRAQLKEVGQVAEEKERQAARAEEQLVEARREVAHHKQRLDRLLHGFQPPPTCDDRTGVAPETERLQMELANTKREMELAQDGIEEERIRWLEEKEKVIRYQKQLQLSYIHMYRRSRTLENEIEHLTLELRCRDAKVGDGESQC